MRMSELVKGDEALSDDYEEGEILEDEAMSVSSSEEIETESGRTLRKKKEHKCKETSLCRKERPGKKCIGRILMKTTQGPDVLHSMNEIGINNNQSFRTSQTYQRTVYISAKPVYYKMSQLSKQNEGNDNRKTERTLIEKSHEKENKIIRKKYPDRPYSKKWNRRRPRREQAGAKEENESVELMELRMEALKSAVISKHVARKKKGKKVKKSSCSLEESLKDDVLGQPEPETLAKDEKTISFSGPLKFSLQPKAPHCLKNNVLEKLEKRKTKWDAPQDPSNPNPEEEEEVLKLREIALMSVKTKSDESKKPVTFNNCPTTEPNQDEIRVVEMDIDEESQEQIVESEDFFNDDGSPNVDLDGLPIKMAKGEPLESIKNSEESWDEDLDEEILRAQCLSSLASKIPSTESSPEKPSLQLLKIPQNPRIIINLNDTDSTSEEEDDPPHKTIENSVDKLLEEARQKVEIEQKTEEKDSAPVTVPPPLIQPTPTPITRNPIKSKTANNKIVRKKMDLRKVTMTKNAKIASQKTLPARTPALPGTPLAVKHLPVQRQEEYRQLKLRLALLKKKAAEASTQESPQNSTTQPQKAVTQQLNKSSDKDDNSPKNKIIEDGNKKQKKNEEELLNQSEISLKKAANLVNIRWTAMNDVVEGMEKIKSDYLALESEMYRKMQEVFAIKEEMAKKANLIHRRTCILSDNSSSMETDLTTYSQMKNRCQNLGSKLRGPSYKLPSEEPMATVEKSVELLRRGESLCSDIKSSSSINLGSGPPAKKIKTVEVLRSGSSSSVSKKTLNNAGASLPISSTNASIPPSFDTSTGESLVSPNPAEQAPETKDTEAIQSESRTSQSSEANQSESRTSQSSGASSGKLYRTSSNWDPHTLICPFDLCGECRDETCTYQHFEASSQS